MSHAARLLVVTVRFYQVVLGPHLGGHCRYQPTCSAYAIEALQSHGALAGTWLAARRILRCHPFARAGFDPVPKASGRVFRAPEIWRARKRPSKNPPGGF